MTADVQQMQEDISSGVPKPVVTCYKQVLADLKADIQAEVASGNVVVR